MKLHIHHKDTIGDASIYYQWQARNKLKPGDWYWRVHTGNHYQIIFSIGNYFLSRS